MEFTNELFEIPIYNQDFHIFYGTPSEYILWTTSHFNCKDSVTDFTIARTAELSKPGKRDLVLFININHVQRMDENCFRTISHELIHLTGYVMDHASVQYDFHNDEPFAYLQGYLSQQVFLFLRQRLKV